MKDHILSLSYGKDSMACLGAIEELGWPLMRIVTVDLWATPTIPAETPDMVEFKKRADAEIKRRYGITVEHFTTTYTEGIHGERVSFEECFYRKMTSGRHIGTIRGFPMIKGNWCTKMKTNAMKNALEDCGDCIQYLGIAADEPLRIERHINRPGIKLPLVEIRWTEADCRKWCAGNGLLSPIYETAERGGCWFCHNQGGGSAPASAKAIPGILGAHAEMGHR